MLTCLTLKVTEPELQRPQAVREETRQVFYLYFLPVFEQMKQLLFLLQKAQDEGSQSHAVAAEFRTTPDLRDQATEDPGGWTWTDMRTN